MNKDCCRVDRFEVLMGALSLSGLNAQRAIAKAHVDVSRASACSSLSRSTSLRRFSIMGGPVGSAVQSCTQSQDI